VTHSPFGYSRNKFRKEKLVDFRILKDTAGRLWPAQDTCSERFYVVVEAFEADLILCAFVEAGLDAYE